MKNIGRSVALLAIAVLFALPALAAEEQTLVLEIKGMHCAGCASGIEAMLKRVDGVAKVEVSYEEAQARVDYDPAKTSAEKIIEAVEKLGYTATPKK